MPATSAQTRLSWPSRPFLTGMLATLAAVALAAAVAQAVGPESPLQRVVIVFVAAGAIFAGALAGRGAALGAGLVGAVSTILFFAAFSTREEMGARLWVGSGVGLSILLLAYLVGAFRTRADQANARALAVERERVRLAEEASQEAELARHEVERKAAALADANAELARANKALAALNEDLEAFTYVVAHDLKEPVRAVSVYLDDAEAEALKPSVREAIRAARLANDRLARLLTGLLELARASLLDPGDLKPIDPIAVLQSDACETRFAAVRDERGARIESSSLIGTPPVRATEEHFCQIMGNLVLNAIKHSRRASPLVRVRVAPQDAEARMVEICVEDDGPGFDPRVLDNMSRGTPARPGRGFGLLIARRAVERLGGTLWFARSKDLGGAAVSFALPSARKGAPPAGPVAADAREPTVAEPVDDLPVPDR